MIVARGERLKRRQRASQLFTLRCGVRSLNLILFNF